MKKVTVVVVFTIISLVSKSQVVYCSDEPFWTFSAGYAFSSTEKGMAFEVGKTGNEENWALYGGALLNVYERQQREAENNVTPSLGTLYMKGGLRLFRVDYATSLYVMGSVGYGLDNTLYSTTSVRLLIPMGRAALSFEPSYNIMTSKYFTQLNLHVMMN